VLIQQVIWSDEENDPQDALAGFVIHGGLIEISSDSDDDGQDAHLQSIWFQLHLRLLRKVSANGLSLYTLLILGPRTPDVGHEETSSTSCQER
jgi:hypothetical protein